MSSVVRSVEMFEQLSKDERVCVLLNRQQKTLSHCLPLSAYLFKPVQRILKYHLLLQVLHVAVVMRLSRNKIGQLFGYRSSWSLFTVGNEYLFQLFISFVIL